MSKYYDFSEKILEEAISWFWWLYDTQKALNIYHRWINSQERAEYEILLKYMYLFQEGISINIIRTPLYQQKSKMFFIGGK